MAEFLEVAIAAARAGGRVLLERLPAERTIAAKGSGIELVTDADRRAEEAIVACIR